MAALKVIFYPHVVLQKKVQKVTNLTQKDLRLIKDMIETMYEQEGVGLAAPQIGVSKSIIVVSPNAVKGEEKVYINPEIIHSSEQCEFGAEGCLSLPDISCEVRRAKKVRIKALDIKGNEFVEEFENFPARVIQHELDHLSGYLIIDRIDFNRRQTLLSSYQRL